jgi:hypothetical protein
MYCAIVEMGHIYIDIDNIMLDGKWVKEAESVKTIDSDLRMIYNGMLFKKIYMHILQLQSENRPK